MQQRGGAIPKEWQSWPQDLPPRATLIRCCAHCTHFVPNPRNPAAGIGDCDIGRGHHFPMEQHNCSGFNKSRNP